MSNLLRWGLRGGLGLTALAAGGTGTYAYKDEGFRRSILFWGQAFPIYAHYRATEWYIKSMPPHVQDEYYNYLHDKYAPKIYSLTLQLRGFFLKLAQICSTRDELVPPQYMKFLKTLQDKVPEEYNPTTVRSMVESSLGKPINEVFSYFEDRPIGAASIGQVHRAKLLDGRDVVVKLQFPKAEKLFRTDIKTILDFCRLAMPMHVGALREIEKQFMTEFNYVKEAENLELVRSAVIPEWGRQVVIPRPFTELCTKDVLVMEYVPGVKLVDGIKDQYKKLAEQQGKTLEQLEEEHKAKIKSGHVKSGPTSFQIKLYTSYLRAKDLVYNLPRFFYNVLYGNWTHKQLPYLKTEAPINLPEILDLLLRVHGYEIFSGGAFNGDPHPGNILLVPDGRLGLIDYGQVKRMTLEDRIKYAKLIIGLADNDDQRILQAFKDIGVKTKYMKPDILLKTARFWNDRDTVDVTNGLNVQLFMEWLHEQDPVVELPDEFVMASRVSILLRGMGNAFQLQLSTAKAWKPYAEALLRQHGHL